VLQVTQIDRESDHIWAFGSPCDSPSDWRVVDRALRTLAQRRAALDAEEARRLREAEALQIWRPLGMVSAIDYMERVLGYSPRAAQERLRVARALGTLPQLTTALTRGELAFSAVRELTRVATPVTEGAWRVAAAGKNLRQIEDLVADHRPGDRPDDPGDPEARTRVVRFELSPETFALLRQTRRVLDDEHGGYLTDDQLVAALCGAVASGGPAAEPTGRARFQIAVTVCERCRQGWQEGAGTKVAISAGAVDRAMCDAQHVGSLDGAGPERAHQDVPPSVVRFVWRRDGGRCRVPGCRSTRGLEVHHLTHRADGGGHEAGNLILACSACHQAHHEGRLTIAGTADRIVTHRSAEAGSHATTGADVGATATANPSTHVGATANANPSTHVGATANANPSTHVGATATASPGPRVTATTTANPSTDVGATATANPSTHVGATATATPSTHVGATATATPSTHVGTTATATPSTHAGATATANPSTHVGATAKANTGTNIAALGDTRIAHPTSSAGLDATIDKDASASAASKLDAVVLRTQTKEALVGLGWKPAIATAAAAAAVAAVGTGTTLERMVFEALRRCPQPSTGQAPK
jgi:hypothetical protein